MSAGRYDRAIARIDAENALDPSGGELAYGQRMSAWLERIEPNASDALRLAVRAQHTGRWRLPRSAYPEGRVAYLKWREELAKRHAETAATLLREVGYEEATVERVASIVRKKRRATDPESQTLEDVACLVFLEHGLAEFAAKHDDDKIVSIVQKTWRKMSPRGHAAAAEIALGDRERGLVARALAETDDPVTPR